MHQFYNLSTKVPSEQFSDPPFKTRRLLRFSLGCTLFIKIKYTHKKKSQTEGTDHTGTPTILSIL